MIANRLLASMEDAAVRWVLKNMIFPLNRGKLNRQVPYGQSHKTKMSPSHPPLQKPLRQDGSSNGASDNGYLAHHAESPGSYVHRMQPTDLLLLGSKATLFDVPT